MQGVNDLSAREMEILLDLVARERDRLGDLASDEERAVYRELNSIDHKISITWRATVALARFRAML